MKKGELKKNFANNEATYEKDKTPKLWTYPIGRPGGGIYLRFL